MTSPTRTLCLGLALPGLLGAQGLQSFPSPEAAQAGGVLPPSAYERGAPSTSIPARNARPGTAQATRPRASASDSPTATPLPPGPASSPVLSLDQAFSMALERHPKMIGNQLKEAIQRDKILAQRGAFDPSFKGKVERQRFRDGVPEIEKRKHQIEVGSTTRAGWKWFVGARLTDTLETAGKKTKLKDFERGFVGIEVPLLRNQGLNAKSVKLLQEERKLSQVEAEVASTQLEFLQKVGDAYWSWVMAQKTVEVSLELERLAEVRVEQVRSWVETGDRPSIDMVEAQREVQKRLGNIAKARRKLFMAQNKLNFYLWADDQAGPIPFQVPEFPEMEALEPDEVVTAVLQAKLARPEGQDLRAQGSLVDLELDYEKNQVRPDFKAFFNLGRESPLDVFEPVERRMRAGIKVEVPLWTRRYQGMRRSLEAKKVKIQTEKETVARMIQAEVLGAANRIETDLERLRASQSEVALALELEKAERTRFELGEGTLFYLNQRERYRGDAQVKQLEIEASVQKAWVEFQAATGRLLPPGSNPERLP